MIRGRGSVGGTFIATGQFLAADGTVALPGYAFTSAPSYGWWLRAGVAIDMSFAGAAAYDFQSTRFTMRSSGSIAWSGTTDPTAAADTGLSRISAGFVGVGNGTSGDFSGKLKTTQLYLDFTNTGTVGSVTINKASGRVNLAAAGTTLTLTNSFITAASKVYLQMASAPGNAVAVSLVAVSAAGSTVITCTPAVTNQTAVDFLVVNAD